MEEEKQNQPETGLTQAPSQTTPTAPAVVGKICKSCKMPNKQYRKPAWKTCVDCLALRPKREQSEGQKRAFKLLLERRQEQINAIRQGKIFEKKDKEKKTPEIKKVVVEPPPPSPIDEDTDDDSPLEEVIKVVKKVKPQPQAKPQPKQKPKLKPKVKKVIVEEEYDDNNSETNEEYEEYEEIKNTRPTKPKQQSRPVVNNQLYVPKYTFY